MCPLIIPTNRFDKCFLQRKFPLRSINWFDEQNVIRIYGIFPNFFLDINWRYFFDWKTPIGYSMCTLFQGGAAVATVEIFICTLTLVGGFCLLMATSITDIEKNLQFLNENVINGEENPTKHIKLKKQFREIMQFYADGKELSISFSFWNGFLYISK